MAGTNSPNMPSDFSTPATVPCPLNRPPTASTSFLPVNVRPDPAHSSLCPVVCVQPAPVDTTASLTADCAATRTTYQIATIRHVSTDCTDYTWFLLAYCFCSPTGFE